LGALLVLAGCSKGTEQALPPPGVPEDDAGVTRIVGYDADVERSVRDGGGGATTKADGGGDSSADGTADGVDAVALPPSITVTVDTASLLPPGDGGVADALIVPASYGPKPVVTVTVVSHSGDMRADDVSSVTASLNDSLTGTPAATAKLARSETDSVPESNTTRFIFSDVPLDLSKVATGAYDLVLTATTVGGTSAKTTVTLWVDTGPTLVVKSPTEGGYYKGSAPVEANVTQPKFAITLVTMALGQGSPVPLTQTSNGVYKGTIDFNSFVPPLEGDQLVTVRAYDENGIQTVVVRRFVSDDTGPSLGGMSPGIGSMIGSVIPIKVTVDDPAGVDTSSVVAVVGNGDRNFEVALMLPAAGGKTYSSLFDTTKLPSYALFPTISFRARDVLGNESTVSYELSLDNTPPTVDLDPPRVRRLKDFGGGLWSCSWACDPLGPDAVDDGDVVTQLFDVRARAEDNGNTPLTGNADFIPIGGVDQGRVQLLILSNTSRPLVVDTSNPPDGFCDDVNPDLVPTTRPQTDNDAQLINMVAMGPIQNADFSPDPSATCSRVSGGTPPDSFCQTTRNDSKAQFQSFTSTPHCNTMTDVLSYAGKLPSIYTIGPIVGDGLQCAGRQFDASNNLKDGWACLAAVASDTLGNKQVSRPIRICVMATLSSKACSDFKPLAGVVLSDPVEIQTSAPLVGPGGAALQENDEVIVSGSVAVTGVNGRWKVNPLDSSGTRFSLQGAHGAGGAASVLASGRVVPVAAMPDCTGTIIKGGKAAGLPVVDYSKPCKPWSTFPPGEVIPYGN
jgi:hypothetical protein